MHILPRPTMLITPSTRSLISPTSREWASTNSGVTVLTWYPLPRSTMQLSWLTLTGVTFSIPHHLLKGLGFKKGVCCWDFTCHMSWSGMHNIWLVFSEGFRLPSWPYPIWSLKALWQHHPNLSGNHWSGGWHSHIRSTSIPSVDTGWLPLQIRPCTPHLVHWHQYPKALLSLHQSCPLLEHHLQHHSLHHLPELQLCLKMSGNFLLVCMKETS